MSKLFSPASSCGGLELTKPIFVSPCAVLAQDGMADTCTRFTWAAAPSAGPAW